MIAIRLELMYPSLGLSCQVYGLEHDPLELEPIQFKKRSDLLQ